MHLSYAPPPPVECVTLKLNMPHEIWSILRNTSHLGCFSAHKCVSLTCCEWARFLRDVAEHIADWVLELLMICLATISWTVRVLQCVQVWLCHERAPFSRIFWPKDKWQTKTYPKKKPPTYDTHTPHKSTHDTTMKRRHINPEIPMSPWGKCACCLTKTMSNFGRHTQHRGFIFMYMGGLGVGGREEEETFVSRSCCTYPIDCIVCVGGGWERMYK